MDPPVFLNLGMQAPPMNINASTIPTSIAHLNGLPQESKLASYINSRQQQSSTHNALIAQPTSSGPPNSVTKTLAALSLDMTMTNRKGAATGLTKEFLPTSGALGAGGPQPNALAHSSSTPSFHSSFSTANALASSFASTLNSTASNSLNNPLSTPLNSNSLNSNSLNSSIANNSLNASHLNSNSLNSNSNHLNSNVLNSNSLNSNPLAAHNFPPLNGSSFVSNSLNNSSSATPMQYSTALRSSPSIGAQQQPTRPLSPPQSSPDRLLRPGTPDQPGVSYQEHIGGTTYYYTAQEFAALAANNGGNGDPGTGGLGSGHAMGLAGDSVGNTILTLPSFNVAPPTAAHIHHLRTPTNAPHFFVQDELRKNLLERQTLAMAHVAPDQFPDLPREIDYYHELVPLDNPQPQQKSNMFGYTTSVYKATHSKTGVQYCLYRVHGYKLSNIKVTQIVDMWKKLQHSSLVSLREVFTTKLFGDNSIIFVYDYHPGSQTMCSRFNCTTPLQPGWENTILPPPTVNYTTETAQQPIIPNGSLGGREMVSEAVLWNFIIQLTGAIRVIHNGNLACRMLDPSKVLLTDNCSRLRINGCGILDVLNFDASAPNPMAAVPLNQQEDLIHLGNLILSVCVRGAVPRDKIQVAIDLINRTYSRDLSMLIVCLMSAHRIKSINDIMPMIGARFYTAVECATQRADVYESELGKELHNGRLFRLITKLSTVVDRPHVNSDSNWSETGDRYMLKLFRDYLFYQTTEDGRPWLDLGHIVSVLNKLDSGSPDQLVLMSHDGQNVLVTSYSELKTCFLRSFTELMQASSVTSTPLKLS